MLTPSECDTINYLLELENSIEWINTCTLLFTLLLLSIILLPGKF